MAYIVCAEEMEGNWIAHVPDLPGCFASRPDREEALAAVPRAVASYFQWCQGHRLDMGTVSEPMVVGEVIRAWLYDDDYEVNAFFASDRPPLDRDELPEFERLLHATRQDLLACAADLPTEDLDRDLPGERWPISGVLRHVADAEWWYLDRLALAGDSDALPLDVHDRLGYVREHFLQQLAALCERDSVVTLSGETWSARKVMRRAVWHERDHAEHIGKLRRMLPARP